MESVQFKKLMEIIKNKEDLEILRKKLSFLEKRMKDSKCRYPETNELMILFHGSPRKFEKFAPENELKGMWRSFNKGIHFCSEIKYTIEFAKKASSTIEFLIYEIGRNLFGFEYGKPLRGEELEKSIEIYNSIIEDVVKNWRHSKFFKTHSSLFSKWEYISFEYEGRELVGIELSEFLEILGYDPSPQNLSLVDGIYRGKNVGEFIYVCVADIRNPFLTTGNFDDVDSKFRDGERAHESTKTDSTIVKVSDSGSVYYFVCIFNNESIFILGRYNLEEKKFEFIV